MKGRADMKKQEKENPYADIINLPRHVSEVYPQMPIANRAAQFSPFAALTGHSAAVREATRPTEAKRELGEYDRDILDRKLRILQAGRSAGNCGYIFPAGRQKRRRRVCDGFRQAQKNKAL